MIIRDYNEVDKDQILQLHDEFMREFFPEFLSEDPLREEGNLEEIYAYFIHQPGKFWIVEDQELIVGLIGVQLKTNKRADLIQLRVRKSHRRRGIGTLLVEKVEEFALSRGKERMILHTAERLVNARKLYEKSGYILESSTKTSPPLEFTVMTYRKDLLSEKKK
ncbi:MAG: GNAT family N-acetyltransferase [Candidatus Hodarchaeota archaeon]